MRKMKEGVWMTLDKKMHPLLYRVLTLINLAVLFGIVASFFIGGAATLGGILLAPISIISVAPWLLETFDLVSARTQRRKRLRQMERT